MDNDVVANFAAREIKPAPARMRLFIPGSPGRDYSTALAPETKEAPDHYSKEPTPVLVIRQQGEAWDRPFAVIYEPFSGSEKSGSIEAVTALTQDGKFAGFKIISTVTSKSVTQYVLTPAPADGGFTDHALGITFRGRYAVITLNDRDECTSLYLGDGSQLRYQDQEINATAGAGAYAEFSGTQFTKTPAVFKE